jgi:hypothetical protein
MTPARTTNFGGKIKMKKIVRIMAILAAISMLAVCAAAVAVDVIVELDPATGDGTITYLAAADVTNGEIPVEFDVSVPAGIDVFGAASNNRLPGQSQTADVWNSANGAFRAGAVIDGSITAGTWIFVQEFEGATLDNFRSIGVAPVGGTSRNSLTFLPADEVTTVETTTGEPPTSPQEEITTPEDEGAGGPGAATGGPDDEGEEEPTGVPKGGVALAIIPTLVAAGAAIVVSKKRK